MTKAVALIGGVLTEVELVSPVKFVILTETGGDPVAVQPYKVERLEHSGTNKVDVYMDSGDSVTVQGTVVGVKALLEAGA